MHSTAQLELAAGFNLCSPLCSRVHVTVLLLSVAHCDTCALASNSSQTERQSMVQHAHGPVMQFNKGFGVTLKKPLHNQPVLDRPRCWMRLQRKHGDPQGCGQAGNYNPGVAAAGRGTLGGDMCASAAPPVRKKLKAIIVVCFQPEVPKT